MEKPSGQRIAEIQERIEAYHRDRGSFTPGSIELTRSYLIDSDFITSYADLAAHCVEDMPYLLSQLAEQAKEIERLHEAQRWIPVSERLPESGTHVLLCCEIRPSKRKYVCDGYYAAKLSITAGGDCDLDTDYDDEKDEFFLPEGFYEVIENWDDYSSIVIGDFVTHWMPLPEMPKEG